MSKRASPKKQDKPKDKFLEADKSKTTKQDSPDKLKESIVKPETIRSPERNEESPDKLRQSMLNPEPLKSPDQDRSREESPVHNIDQSKNFDSANEPEVIPTDKDELIEFLKNKLVKTQDTINEAFEVLKGEKEMTGKLVQEFDAKRREFTSIQKDTNRPLREKVHEKIEKVLEKAIHEKVEAETKRDELRTVIVEKKMMRGELAFTLRYLQAEDVKKELELKQLLKKVTDYENKITELSKDKMNSENASSQKSDEIARLRRERDDMRGVMRKLSDAKHVLNRLFSNPDLLYTREGTLEHLSKDLVITVKKKGDQNLLSQSINPKQSQPLPAKPTYMVNEDDFWYADNPRQEYAKDYGGRENNYNEQYNYNKKIPNKLSTSGNVDFDQPRYSSPTNTLPQINQNRSQNSFKMT